MLNPLHATDCWPEGRRVTTGADGAIPSKTADEKSAAESRSRRMEAPVRADAPMLLDVNVSVLPEPRLTFGDGVANFVEPKATKHDIRFQKEFHGNLGRFEIDPEVISAGLVNILENAVDACIEDESK